MNLSVPNNCDAGQTNPVFAGSGQQFATRLFSYFDFDKVIKDTLNDDIVIQNIKDTSPYFGGSVFSFNNIVATNLYHQMLRATLSTHDMYKKMQTIRHQYIVDCALRIIINDSLSPDPFTGEIFKITCNDEHPKSNRINVLIKQFVETFQIDRWVEEKAADAIFWGEYAMTLQTNKGTDRGEHQGEPGIGITQIIDANDPGTIFGVWESMHPKYYIRLKKGINTALQGQMERLEPTSVWHIGISPREIDFSLGYGNWFYDDSNKIAQKFRIGTPLFYSVYSKVLELEAFEQAQFQKEFGDLKRRGLIAVQAPAGIDLLQQHEFSKFYEKVLNESNGPDDLNNLQGLEAINYQMSSLSNVRVIPMQPDRGKMDAVDLKIAADNIMDKINDRRKIILESIGIPFEYVYGSRSDGKQNLRQYIGYSRRCQQIQNGIAWSLKRLLQTHLINCGIKVSQQDIDVRFYKAINVAELDSIEARSAVVAHICELDDRIQMWLQNPAMAKYINVSEYARFIDKYISKFDGTGNIIVVPVGEQTMGDAAMAQSQPQDPNSQTETDSAAQPPSSPQPATPRLGAAQGGFPTNVKTSGGSLPLNVKTVGGTLPPNVTINS
jgi:hypothetical protein